MSATNPCPHCGKPLPPGAPGGLCPQCMLKAGVATPTGEAGPHGTRLVNSARGPVPSVEEIARHFPELEILRRLGQGGMGVVYQARQPKLDRLVALKILAPEKEAEPKFAERFAREAQALARLNHPNIVTVHDFGEREGLYYLLMEFVDGVSLRQLLVQQRVRPDEALAIVPTICEALQFAHQQGVVHRDIKPENILLDKQGRVKIADFGIAKLVGQAQPAQALTEERQVIGTPHYMAPEQVEKPQAVDHRADIYSLGVVFYEMLTGELPLGRFAPPSRKVQVDVRLDEVVLRALEKEPERRYQQAREVGTDVESIVGTPPVMAHEHAPSPKPDLWARLKYRLWPPLVIRRNGRRCVNWPAVVMRGLRAVLVSFSQSLILVFVVRLLGSAVPPPFPAGIFSWSATLLFVVVFGVFLGLVSLILAIRLLRGFAVPLEQLPELEPPSPSPSPRPSPSGPSGRGGKTLPRRDES
jgi:serine/threonine protein kinase